MKTTSVLLVAVLGAAVRVAAQQTEDLVNAALNKDVLTLRLPEVPATAVAPITQAGEGKDDREFEQELVQEAARRGITERIDILERLRRSRWQILVGGLREDVVRMVPAPREDEIRRSFEQEKARWRLPEAYRVDAYVTVATNYEAVSRMKAMVAARQLNVKALEEVQAQRIASSAKESWLARDNFHPDIWAILPGMSIDELRMLKVDQEVVIVRKAAVRAERAMTLDEAREPIKMYLQSGKADAAWNAFLKRKMSEMGMKE